MKKKEVFESKLKNTGPVNFKELYNFCYDWLSDETNLIVAETAYVEKIANGKNIEATWNAFRKVTDYFKYTIEVKWRVVGLKDVEYQKDGKKLKTNTGSIEMKVKGTVIRDYEGKFDTSQFKSWMNKIYEKWLIKARIEQFEDQLLDFCDEFVDQSKAFMETEAQKAKSIDL